MSIIRRDKDQLLLELITALDALKADQPIKEDGSNKEIMEWRKKHFNSLKGQYEDLIIRERGDE